MLMDCDKETLILSDDKLFYTLEGEGEYVGVPSVFFRLAMCNLTCKHTTQGLVQYKLTIKFL